MSIEKQYEHRELIIMIGMTASGKSYYVNENYIRNHQIVSENHIVEAMKLENIELAEDLKNMITAVTTRALMIKGLPIVVDEPNLTLQSLFIWSKFAFHHNYKTQDHRGCK